MKHEIDTAKELEKQGLRFDRAEVPDPDQKAPRFWVRYSGGAWESIEAEYGQGGALTRSDAVRRAIFAAEKHDATALEVASAPNDAKVFYCDGLPPRKGAPLREVLEHGRFRSTRIPFSTVARTQWANGRTRTEPLDLSEIAPNGGAGELIWERPYNLEIPLPAELAGAAPDRVSHWETIAHRLADEALGTQLASDVDTAKISRAAFKEYERTFREAVPPADTVGKWSEAGQIAWRQMHEALCKKGMARHSVAPGRAVELVAQAVAGEIVSGVRTL